MSIWSSVFDPSGDWYSDDLDEYTGEPEAKPDDRFRWTFDVATAAWFNDLIRFSMGNAVGWDADTREWLPGKLDVEALLTVEQATNLRDRLTAAIDRVQNECNPQQAQRDRTVPEQA